jgi:8-oxo-dGTP pyrophosphatase MutT (NUDIX family)
MTSPLLKSTRDLLGKHAPLDENEAKHLQAMHRLAAAGPEIFTRSHYEPGHFTASAFVVSPTGDAMLLVHHPKLERWLQPGGHVEARDGDLMEAARREAIEETGITNMALIGDGIFDVDVHVIPARKDEPEHRHFDVRFLFRAGPRELKLEEGIQGAHWVPLHQVTVGNSDSSVARAVAKLLSEESAVARLLDPA